MTSAEDIAQHILTENGITELPSPVPATEQKQSNKTSVTIQFRFGNTAFFISQVELDCLNAKYAEYVDQRKMLKCSFVDYLLEGVKWHD